MAKNKRKKKDKSAKVLDFNIWHYVAMIFLLIFIFVLNNNKIESNDTWWHLQLGKWMVENKSFLTTEIFSKTAEGKPFVAYEWLSQVIFYYLSDINAINLSIFKIILMLAGSILLGWALVRKYWHGTLTYPILALLTFLMAFRAEVRPHLFGMWCTAFLIMGLTRWQEHWDIKKLWWLIPLHIFWANNHGSFLLAPCLVLFYAGALFASQFIAILPGDRKQSYPKSAVIQLLFLALVLFLTSLINPYGYQLLHKSLTMFFTHNYMREHIREWHSIINLPPGNWFFAWFFWIGLGWLLIFKNRKAVTTFDICILGLATVFPFTGVRFLTLSALMSFPLLLKYSYKLWPSGLNPKIAVAVMLPLIIYIGICGYPQSYAEHRTVGFGFNYKQVPLDIVQHIKSHNLKGVMMNHYNDGAYIVYYNYPDVQTVMDSRTEVFGQELFEEHQNAYTHYDKFKRYINKYDVNLILVQIANKVLRNYLFEDPNWKLEKVGLSFDLFSKVTSKNPKTVPPSRLDSILGLTRTRSSASVDEKSQYCIFVRLYGHCFQAPECEIECKLTDEMIAEKLGLQDSMCLKFSQACFKKDSACSNCRSFCEHYKIAMPKLNKTLGFEYPTSPTCF